MDRSLRVGSFQFAAGSDITSNVTALGRGIARAARAGIRLLLTQECGLCGYPPVERDAVASIDLQAQQEALEEVCRLARRHEIHVVVGLVTPHGTGCRNSVRIVAADGIPGEAYHKRALWGWDLQSFVPGDTSGIYTIEGLRVGVRICYEARFPEYFRELFRQEVDLALVALSNVGDAARRGQAQVYRAHLISRASENAMWVLSANSVSRTQLAPSCLIDRDGTVAAECRADVEDLLVGQVEIGEPGLSTQGRIVVSRALTGMEETP